jgi:hypothetical protein
MLSCLFLLILPGYHFPIVSSKFFMRPSTIYYSPPKRVACDWVHLAHWWLAYCISPRWWMIDDRGTVSGMRIGRGNRNTRRKPTVIETLFTTDSSDLTWATVVGSRWLTTWAMAWPCCYPCRSRWHVCTQLIDLLKIILDWQQLLLYSCEGGIIVWNDLMVHFFS